MWEASGLRILAAFLTKLSMMELKSTNIQLLFGLSESMFATKNFDMLCK